MRNNRIWAGILGVDDTVVEAVNIDDESGCVVVAVRSKSTARSRCGMCRRRCPGYDSGHGRRRWRALDAGRTPVFVEAWAPRVSCPTHGVVVADVPWARLGAGHTLAFDATVAWLATHCAKSAVCELMGIAWRTVGSIIDRVWTDTEARFDRFAGGCQMVCVSPGLISERNNHEHGDRQRSAARVRRPAGAG